MRSLVCTLLCLSFLTVFAHAQLAESYASGREVSAVLTCSPAPCRLPNTRVSQGVKTKLTAPNLAINAQNPLQMVLGVEDTSCTSWGASYSTNDGGTTWTKTCFPVVGVIDVIVSTWMVYDNSGVVHALLGTSNLDCGEDIVLESHSSDNGATWSALNQISSVQFQVMDSQAMDNNPSSPFAGSIYGSVTQSLPFNKVQIQVWRSTDGGGSWTPTVAATLPDTFGFDSEGFSHLEVGKDGTMYMSYMASPSAGSTPNEMMFTKSTDGGQTWSNPVKVFAATAVNTIPNTTVPLGDGPVLAVDNSPAGKSRLYMTFYNWTGTFMQVVVTHSGDGGNTWSSPVPVAPASANHDQFKPYVSVSSTGSVAVTWLDRRDDPANVNYRTYAAFSKSGIFSANIALSAASSTPTYALDYTNSPAANAWSGSTLFTVWPDIRTSGVVQQFIGGYKQQ